MSFLFNKIILSQLSIKHKNNTKIYEYLYLVLVNIKKVI